MIIEMIFKILFFVPGFIISIIPSFPAIDFLGSLAGLSELLAIGNQFFPVGQVASYALVWFGLQVIALFKWGVDWILSLIPMY